MHPNPTFALILAACGLTSLAVAVPDDARPNIVLIYADDLGYGDLSCYGNERHRTPHLDQMAAEGARLTSFYVATPSCAPSRVALLTGRFPYRTGVPSNPAPDAGLDHGIQSSEVTLAELLREQGYATQIVGKWHLGHLPQYYPTRHGFDAYFGILYSNDMRPVMLCRDDQVVEYPVVQNYLTQRYTAEAIDFIEENADRPFFLYFPHAMPHKPLAASENFYTPESRDDLYSDVVRELDWSVGQVLDTLKRLGIDRRTLVVFSSDNGPSYGGSTGGLRGTKGSGYEGGVREPCIVRWPDNIPAGQVIDVPCATVDIFPTICSLLNIDSQPYSVDGFNIWPVLSEASRGPDRAIYTWNGKQLLAVRKGPWKLHVTQPRTRVRGVPGEDWVDERGPDGATIIAPFEQAKRWHYPAPEDTPASAPARAMQLFNLLADPAEQTDVTADHPTVLAELRQLAEAALDDANRTEMRELASSNLRFYHGPGRITQEQPLSISEALQRSRATPGNDHEAPR